MTILILANMKTRGVGTNPTPWLYIKGGVFLANIEEKVEQLLKDKVSELGYELYDVEYAKEGKQYFLRVFIDKEEGIDINDCEKVNNGIMELLDKADYIKEAYFLEVSSPGIERVLRKNKHLQANIGTEVEISLFKSFEGKKRLEGILGSYNENEIIIIKDKEKITIERKDISLIKTKYNWEELN